MDSPKFEHFDLKLHNPSFDSPLVDVVTELEHLRRLQLGGTTPPEVFFQLKQIFHLLESLGSARIEGNHTTLADLVESTVQGGLEDGDQMKEITNIEEAMRYVEEAMQPGAPLTETFIRDLHGIAVNGLEREGDKTPGAYRESPVKIAMSAHLPPEAIAVPQYMRELTEFVNTPSAPKYDLIKVALAHHRFGWIHPFSNGNGRVVRLLTYALLIKYGFNVKDGRVLNPTAVFCNDRERYYQMLGAADTGQTEGIDIWCTYVLEGILTELRKVDRLTQYDYLEQRILKPALSISRERQLITIDEYHVLLEVVKLKTAKSGDLKLVMPKLTDNQRTYQIRKLVDQKMLQPIYEGARQYSICFTNNYLLRGVIKALTDEGFISNALEA
ncbi:Fic family protein [Duganella sp. LX20W]|uniref:Fic family protein n=1 Tax=Rugamonas brunnea TaxID=2758569 RepID=A0A7W2ERC4_9BURK|nr:Fic family protein [Rugamonas brunnea]MBA5637173.1 Fic family protein [Rugamonas brunnea]